MKFKVRYSTERGDFSPTTVVEAESKHEAAKQIYEALGDVIIESIEAVQ